MNAYELADIVDRWAYKESAEYLTDAANMLRQQADRIAELEKELYFKNYYEELPDTPVGIYTTPQKYCPTENNAAYEKGVIDGMAKQRESRVDGIIGQIGDSPIHDLVHRTTPQIKELTDRIAELEKSHIKLEQGIVADLNQRQSAEPVAWFDGEYYVCPELGYEDTITEQHPKDLGWIPLYTTPQIKELSDEEINAVYHEVWNSNKWSDVEGIDIEKFARAILKKASEK